MATKARARSFRTKVREQLRLFKTDTQSPEVMATAARNGASVREVLTSLLKGPLDFHGHKTGYATHDLHAFAAKFPPQLPRTFILALTEPGDLVLDPMMGSGTALVEAILTGRRAVGVDLDPLSVLLSQVKTRTLDLDMALRSAAEVLASATKEVSSDTVEGATLFADLDPATKKFIDYWFHPSTQIELSALVRAIRSVAEPSTRRFLWLTLSAVIVTKSGGVSLARDLAHSRPHLDPRKRPRNALEQFQAKVRKNVRSLATLHINSIPGLVIDGDARHTPLRTNSVDLIVTSPPYANAIDYMRAHKFSLVWLGRAIPELSRLRSLYLGSERGSSRSPEGLPQSVRRVIDTLQQRDPKKASILCKYFLEMRLVLSEMHRVLRKERPAIVVVGTSVMRGVDVETHTALAAIAETLGFDVVATSRRELDRDRRLMPFRAGGNSQSGIENRMSEEYVIGLVKRPSSEFEENAFPGTDHS